MKKYTVKKAVSLMELIMVLLVMGILLIPTIDLMSSMLIAQADFSNNLQAKQIKLNITERIVSGLREGSYIYSNGSSLLIPTISSSTIASVGSESIAVLIPVFQSDGSVEYSESTNETSFRGVAYSIIPESTWNGNNTGQYVIVETIYNTSLTTDPDDKLKITETAPIDWSLGSSFLLADKLEPATLTNMGTNAFNINNSIVTFSFVPGSTTTYFASSNGTSSIDDTSYISSVVVQNSR
jgi:hypothetical protein